MPLHHNTATALWSKCIEEEGEESHWTPPALPAACRASGLQWMADASLWGGGGACVQLEESEFTCAAAVKARKAMEVEIEDLHLQIDDIAKAKTAVRVQWRQGRARGGRGERC